MQAHVNLVDMHECARMVKFLEIPTKENLKAYIMNSSGFYREELAEQRLLLNAYIIRDGKIYPRMYVTEEELRVYTICSDKFYPREDAYAKPLLKYLLREITGKYNGNRRIGREGKRKRGGEERARKGRTMEKEGTGKAKRKSELPPVIYL
jgi:hypothetical protein